MKVGVLASGEGSNLQAILDRVHGRDGVEVVAVGSDKPRRPGAERAPRAAGVPARAFAARSTPTGARATRRWPTGSRQRGVELVVLAGYMQLLDPAFLARFPRRVINVHPALLPAFPGIGAVEQAVAYGVKVFGVTVHFVDEGVDTGPIIAQRALELPGRRPTRDGARRAAPARARPAVPTSCAAIAAARSASTRLPARASWRCGMVRAG